MTTFKCFSDLNGETIELNPRSIKQALAGHMEGEAIDAKPTWSAERQCWNRVFYKVTRSVEYKSHPSKHVCDVRCQSAKGRTMKCECACGGKNHGRAA